MLGAFCAYVLVGLLFRLPLALEALFGQIFLVTMVARLVTLWVRQGPVGERD